MFATPRKCRIRTIISESGRAIVAHHSVLIVEVFGAIEKIRPGDTFQYGDSEHALVRELLDIKKNLSKANKLEAFHDAQERKEDAQQMFALGLLDLPDKAQDRKSLLGDQPGRRRELQRPGVYSRGNSEARRHVSPTSISAIFPCSSRCSITGRSDNYFPSCRLSRLNERPTREATLVDITCDSDGQVNKFIDLRDVRDTLPLHKLNTNGNGKPEPYYHRLFSDGRVPGHHGRPAQSFRPRERGPRLPRSRRSRPVITSRKSLKARRSSSRSRPVQYDENELKRQMKAQMDEAIKSDRMKPSEAMRLLDDYEKGLRAYTYLNF